MASPDDGKFFERASAYHKGVCVGIHLFFYKGHPSDLTTEKFLAVFAHFLSRRGCPRQVQSDNGKTFVGALALLTRDFLQAVK